MMSRITLKLGDASDIKEKESKIAELYAHLKENGLNLEDITLHIEFQYPFDPSWWELLPAKVLDRIDDIGFSDSAGGSLEESSDSVIEVVKRSPKNTVHLTLPSLFRYNDFEKWNELFNIVPSHITNLTCEFFLDDEKTSEFSFPKTVTELQITISFRKDLWDKSSNASDLLQVMQSVPRKLVALKLSGVFRCTPRELGEAMKALPLLSTLDLSKFKIIHNKTVPVPKSHGNKSKISALSRTTTIEEEKLKFSDIIAIVDRLPQTVTELSLGSLESITKGEMNCILAALAKTNVQKVNVSFADKELKRDFDEHLKAIKFIKAVETYVTSSLTKPPSIFMSEYDFSEIDVGMLVRYLSNQKSESACYALALVLHYIHLEESVKPPELAKVAIAYYLKASSNPSYLRAAEYALWELRTSIDSADLGLEEITSVLSRFSLSPAIKNYEHFKKFRTPSGEEPVPFNELGREQLEKEIGLVDPLASFAYFDKTIEIPTPKFFASDLKESKKKLGILGQTEKEPSRSDLDEDENKPKPS